MKAAQEYTSQVIKGEVQNDPQKLSESFEVIKTDETNNSIARNISKDRNAADIEIGSTFASLAGIPIAGAGLGMYIDNKEPKPEQLAHLQPQEDSNSKSS